MKIFYFIRKSFPIQYNQFIAATPIPGLKFTNCYGKKLQQFFWFAVLKLNVLVMIAVSLKFWNQFQYRGILEVYQDLEQGIQLSYPAVYLCLAFPLSPNNLAKYRKNFLKSNLTMSISDIDYNLQLMLRFQRSALNVSYNMHELFARNVDIDLLQKDLSNLYYKVEELFKDCSFQGVDFECKELFIPTETAPGHCFVFNSIYTGKSFHNDPQEVLYAKFSEFDEDWTLRFKMLYEENTFLLIYLQHPHNLISLTDYITYAWRPGKLISKYGFSIQEFYSEENIKNLTLSQRLCLFPDETFPAQNLRAEFKANFYNQNVCFNYCHALKFIELCNCLPTFGKHIFPKLANNTKVRICGIKDMECYENNYLSVRRTKCEECFLNCKETLYVYDSELQSRADMHDFINKPALQKDYFDFTFDLDYWPLLCFRELNIYSTTEFILDLASTASLFMGISILTFLELFYNLFIRFPCFYFVNKEYFVRTVKKREQIEHMKSIPLIDMSLKPGIKL